MAENAKFNHLKANSIECQSILIGKPGSDYKANIMVLDDGIGIWMTDEKRMVVINIVGSEISIGLRKGVQGPTNVAICLNEGGEPYIQVVEKPGKEPDVVLLKDLLKR